MPITTDGLKWVNQSLFGTWGKPSHLTVTDGTTMAHSKFTVVEISASGTTAKLRAEFGPDLGNFAWNKWSVTNGQASGLIKLNEVIQNNGVKLQGQTWTLTVELKFNTVVRRIFEGFLPYTVSHTLRGSTEYSSLEGVTYQNLLSSDYVIQVTSSWTRNTSAHTLTKSLNTYIDGGFVFATPMIKANTTYTLVLTVKECISNTLQLAVDGNTAYAPSATKFIKYSKGTVLVTFMTRPTLSSTQMKFKLGTNCAANNEAFVLDDRFLLLEGDYTNKPIPSYLEGIESVAESEINLLNTGKFIDNKGLGTDGSLTVNNDACVYDGVLLDVNETYTLENFSPNTPYLCFSTDGGKTFTARVPYTGSFVAQSSYLRIATLKVDSKVKLSANKGGTKVRVKSTGKNLIQNYMKIQKGVTERIIPLQHNLKKGKTYVYQTDLPEMKIVITYASGNQYYLNQGGYTVTTTEEIRKVEAYIDSTPWDTGNLYVANKLQIEEGSTKTEFELYKEDKKEIQLTEPLRGFPTGVKDKIQQRDDGVYLTKRVDKFILTENVTIQSMSLTTNNIYRCLITMPGGKADSAVICDRFKSLIDFTSGVEHMYCGINQCWLFIDGDKLSTKDGNGLKAWLRTNPTTVYFQLVTPIETKLPVGTNINLETYDEVTNFFSENKVTPLYSTVALVSN